MLIKKSNAKAAVLTRNSLPVVYAEKRCVRRDAAVPQYRICTASQRSSGNGEKAAGKWHIRIAFRLTNGASRSSEQAETNAPNRAEDVALKWRIEIGGIELSTNRFWS